MFMMIKCGKNTLFGIEYSDSKCETQPVEDETHLPYDLVKWEPVYFDLCVKTEFKGVYMKVFNYSIDSDGPVSSKSSSG